MSKELKILGNVLGLCLTSFALGIDIIGMIESKQPFIFAILAILTIPSIVLFIIKSGEVINE